MSALMLSTGCWAVEDLDNNEWTFEENTVKLEPKIRVEPIENARTIVTTEDIEAYLRKVLVLDTRTQFQETAYIVAESREELIFGQGAKVYVKGEFDQEEPLFDVYKREGQYLHHPETGENLGFVASVVGEAELRSKTDPATFAILSAKEGIELGSRLLPSFAGELPLKLTVKPARIREKGYILKAEGNVDANSLGMNQVVVVSLGERDGLQEGNVLTIYRPGKKVIDPTTKSWNPSRVTLPETEAGRLLVYKTYDKLSVGIITEAKGIIRLLDIVKSP